MSGAMLGSVSVPKSRRDYSTLPASFGAAVSAAEMADLLDRYPLSLPLHSLVSDVNLVNNRLGLLTTHVWASPSYLDCFYQLSPGLYVCSPELTFLQMASTLPLLELIKLGFELCCTYRMRGDDIDYHQDPLTDVSRLRKVVELHRGKTGAAKALKALEYVRDRAGSPREIALAMLIGLPYKYGGASFGMPTMNQPVDLSPEAKTLASKDKCICDLYFPRWSLDLEYEGYEFHSGSSKMEQDSLRRDALALMGVKVITVTNKQIIDLDKLNALIKLISKTTGKRFRPEVAGFAARQRELQRMFAT